MRSTSSSSYVNSLEQSITKGGLTSMSETVHYKGTLLKVERLEGETLEEQCKRLLGGKPLPSFCDTYEEFLLDEYYKTMTIQNGTVYEVAKIEVDVDSDIYHANLRADGKIDFEVRYYNGSCGFDEAISEAVKSLEKTAG